MSGEVRGPGNRRPNSEPSPREREVLELRAQGITHKEIARRLDISAHTVKNHITSAHQRAIRVLGWDRKIKRPTISAPDALSGRVERGPQKGR